MRAFFTLLVLFLSCQCLYAQCSGGSCYLPTQLTVQPLEEMTWKIFPRIPGQALLFDGNRQIGGYDFESGLYRSLFNGTWQAPSSPPIAAPLSGMSIGQQPRIFPNGVDSSGLSGRDRFSIDGRTVTEDEAKLSMMPKGFGQVPDDSGLRHLTIICNSNEEKAKILQQLEKPIFKDLDKSFRVQVYAISRNADTEILKPFRLNEDDKFTASGLAGYVQEVEANGKGKVIGAFYQWTDAEDLFEHLRKCDPDYFPKRNRHPNNPIIPFPWPSNPLAGITVGTKWICVLLAFILLVLLIMLLRSVFYGRS